MEKNIYKRLGEIQCVLEAPKNKFSEYGGFHYRSAEDIEIALKPLLKEQDLLLTLDDGIELVGERYYVRATAELIDINEPSNVIKKNGYAREMATKTKSDESQLTGLASSYARKRALEAMFLIDDGQDPDGKKPKEPKKTVKPAQQTIEFATPTQIQTLRANMIGAEFAQTMNACGGKLPHAKYVELMEIIKNG